LGKNRIILLAIIVGLIIVSYNVGPTHAQVDGFPIGMNLSYITNVFFQYTPEIPEYEITFDFIQWADQDNLVVEYDLDSVRYNQSFLEVRLPLAERPYLWMDVTSWSLYEIIEISGIYYQIIQIVDHFMGTFGDIECFRLEYILSDEAWENATDLYYHTELGLLLDYTHWVESIPGNWSRIYSSFVLSGNFNVFNPPTFTIPPPDTTTTTTSTTTTTTTTTPYDPTTSPTATSTPTPDSSPSIGTDILLGVGISIELLIVIIFVRARRN